MDLHLSDAVVLIAGSSRGIGLATARVFLEEGARTVITGRDRQALEQARSSLVEDSDPDRLMAWSGDLRDPDVIAALLAATDERWGRLDCLVANVGNGRGPSGWELAEFDWDRLIDQNFSIAYRLVQQVLPAMISSRQGSIVLAWHRIVGLESTAAPLPGRRCKGSAPELRQERRPPGWLEQCPRQCRRPRQHPVPRWLVGAPSCRAA